MDNLDDSSVDVHETSFQKLQHALQQDEWFKPILEKLEQFTGVKREYIVIGLAVLFVINLILGVGGQLICHAVGLLYPAVQTIYVIESNDKDSSFRWLMYWVVFCSLNFVELFTAFILNFIPCYWLIKCAFLVWCFSSYSINGSVYVYKKLVVPFFVNIPANSNFIDDVIEAAASQVIQQGGKQRNLRPRRKNANVDQD